MPKVTVSLDGTVLKEVVLTQPRTTVGRRPYNDIVIDNLAVSGEHAVLLLAGDEVALQDLDSTNGTYVNGQAIQRQVLRPGDRVEIGKYRLALVPDAVAPPAPPAARIQVLSGSAAGRELELVKVVTTLGKPGVAVAAITRRGSSYVVSHVDGESRPVVNGTTVGAEPVSLKHGDLLEVAGTRMQFVLAG